MTGAIAMINDSNIVACNGFEAGMVQVVIKDIFEDMTSDLGGKGEETSLGRRI